MRILSVIISVLSVFLLATPVLCEEYKIETGDLLHITVFEQPDMETKARVTKGEISFPLLGNVKVEGLAISELEKKLEALLEKDYLVNPRVSVRVEEYHPKKVFVLGSVDKPGAYDLSKEKPTTVLEAITMAGGFTKTAAVNDTKIIRKKSGGQEETIKVRITDITQKGDKDKDVQVQPNDVVFVPESFF
ncbi:MAG: polysaccharide export protein [Candidatus Omnitrophica bacterium]|nr:polysaccharide export protein [Candidatus Omnitrophota bacterium]